MVKKKLFAEFGLLIVGFIICEVDLDKGCKKVLNNNEVING